jgi:hypothetical protein
MGDPRGNLATGDVDGDGLDDILICAGEDEGEDGHGGTAYVFFGPIPSVNSSLAEADLVISGVTGGQLGGGLGAGDLDGDGLDDLLASVSDDADGPAGVHVFSGASLAQAVR